MVLLALIILGDHERCKNAATCSYGKDRALAFFHVLSENVLCFTCEGTCIKCYSKFMHYL